MRSQAFQPGLCFADVLLRLCFVSIQLRDLSGGGDLCVPNFCQPLLLLLHLELRDRQVILGAAALATLDVIIQELLRQLLHPADVSAGYTQTPHCTRHTCISMLAEAHVDQTMIKKIVGHSGAMTLTEKVYTHLDISALVDAINGI